MGYLYVMAESEGFEPPDLLQSTVFKTAAFDHSASSPVLFLELSFDLVTFVRPRGSNRRFIQSTQPIWWMRVAEGWPAYPPYAHGLI